MSGPASAVRLEHLASDEGPAMGAFARALRTGVGDALRFLTPPPADEAGWARWLAEVAAHAPVVPEALAEALAARQVALGTGPKAEAHARALAADGPRTLAVVTGQQPGLLGGPLLTFHKAAGALALARRLDGLGGHRVVPVFWLASEDHDLAEANRAAVIDRAGQPVRLRLGLEPDGRSMLDVAVPAEEAAVLGQALQAALPDTERGHAAAALVAWRPKDDFATWSARALAAVFGDSGLVILEPQVLTPFVGKTYAWLVDHAEPIREAIRSRGKALRAAGLPAPLDPQPDDATALFLRLEAGGRRRRVGLDGQRVTLRDEDSPLDRAALRALLRDEPLRGSGNVIGRVFVQNRHLPVIGYVAGPTEVAYWAQLRAAHEAVGAFFPLALPRPEATWVDAKLEGILHDFGTTPGAVLAGTGRPPAEEDPALEAGLAALAEHLAVPPAAVRALLTRGGRGAAAFERLLERLAQAWSKAEGDIRAGFEADAGTGRARWLRALAALRPYDKPQERVLSPLSWIARYGVEPVREGLRALDPLRPVHHVVHLGGQGPARPEEDPA